MSTNVFATPPSGGFASMPLRGIREGEEFELHKKAATTGPQRDPMP